MIAVFDVDGTLDACPREFQSMMSALKAAAHQVHILTGVDNDPPTQQDWDEKCAYLAAMGMAECWDKLILVPRDRLIAQRKAAYLASVRADVFVDNSEENVAAAAQAGVPLCLLPWQTRI